MAFTPQQLAILDAAIAEGTLKVEYGDKKVEYRSLNEMLNIRALMAAELGEGKPRRTYASFSKGTYPDNCE